MAIEIIREVVEDNVAVLRSLTPSERLVLFILAYHADKDRQCWPGNKTIGEESGMAPAQASRAVQRLADLGLIKIVKYQSPRYIEMLMLRIPQDQDELMLRIPQDQDDDTSTQVEDLSTQVEDLSTVTVNNPSYNRQTTPPSPSAKSPEEAVREKKDSLDTTLDHFNNRVKEINIDHGMGLQLGRTYAHDRARGAFGQLRKRLGISWDEIGELVNQYCDYPDRWRIGPGKHPWHDFVSARTQGRLAHELERKRLAAEVAVRNDGAAESKAAEDAARALAWLREQEGTSSSD